MDGYILRVNVIEQLVSILICFPVVSRTEIESRAAE